MTWGTKLAEGRAAEIFEAGPGQVARVARRPVDYAREAEVMELARNAGLPVPHVHSVDDAVMILDRIEGPTMAAALETRPWQIDHAARTLAELHDRVHQVRPPAGALAAAVVPGDRLLHLDLHPENVILSPAGPVIIDWSNAAVGDPRADLAMSWIIMSTSTLDTPWWTRHAAEVIRHGFVRRWLAQVDRTGARSVLRAVGAARAADPNVTVEETERVRRLVVRWATS